MGAKFPKSESSLDHSFPLWPNSYVNKVESRSSRTQVLDTPQYAIHKGHTKTYRVTRLTLCGNVVRGLINCHSGKEQ